MTQETERDGDVQPAIAEVAAKPLPDDLTELAERAVEAFRLCRSTSVENEQACLECGATLAKAKARCGHGKWLPFLERAGIPRRKARRLMRQARSGMDAETLAGKGIRLADEEMSRPGKLATVAHSETDPAPGSAFRAALLRLKVTAEKGCGLASWNGSAVKETVPDTGKLEGDLK